MKNYRIKSYLSLIAGSIVVFEGVYFLVTGYYPTSQSDQLSFIVDSSKDARIFGSCLLAMGLLLMVGALERDT